MWHAEKNLSENGSDRTGNHIKNYPKITVPIATWYVLKILLSDLVTIDSTQQQGANTDIPCNVLEVT